MGVIIIGSFGEKFRQERERQGYDLAAVAEETKIRTLYLRALEEENFDILPARVYATGFVSTYARFLRMDTEAMVREFKSLAYVNNVANVNNVRVSQPSPAKRKIKLPVRNVIAAALFLGIAIWAGNNVVDYIARQPETPSPAVRQQMQEQPPSTAPAVDEQETPEKLTLAIQATEKCWLLVKVDGEQQYTGTMAQGESKTFEANEDISIRAGNAGGLALTLNDKQLAPLGEPWQVAEKTFDLKSFSNEKEFP